MSLVSRSGRLGLISVVLATGVGATVATLHAQTQLSDPRDAPKIFASTCSACHKSPAGLAKSGQVAGFLRQHYTTGPEMSAAMAAYLVSAGSGPAGKKAEARKEPGEPAAKAKQKREASVQPGEPKEGIRSAKEAAKEGRETKESAKEKRLLRKQLQAKAHEEQTAPHPSPASAAEAGRPETGRSETNRGDTNRPEAGSRPAPVPANAAVAEAPAAPAAAQAAPAAPATAAQPMVTLDIPMPEMPTAPPADLTQSVFSSSPVP